MSTWKSFEDIDVWKKSRVLCRNINEAINKNKSFIRDFKLTNQIRRSSGSIMDNIAEGYDRDGKKEFIYFLSISKGSSGEVKSQLYRALDNNYITKEIFDDLYNKTLEIGKMLGGLIKYLKSTNFKGKKFQLETRNQKPETRN